MVARGSKFAKGIMFSSNSTNVPSNIYVLVRVVKASISKEFSSSPFRSRKLQNDSRDGQEGGGMQYFAGDMLSIFADCRYTSRRHTAPTDSRQISENNRQLRRISRYHGFSRCCPETFFPRKLVPPSHTRLRIEIDGK